MSFNQYINNLILNADWNICDDDMTVSVTENRTIKAQLLLSVFAKIRLDNLVLESTVSRNEIICRLIDKDCRESGFTVYQGDSSEE